jgi:beta-barrel assembly-enhancing protease
MHERFSGGVFSESLANGRAGAEISLTLGAVSARTPDGKTFEVSFRECQIEVGGYNGRMIFCRDPQKTVTIFCDDRKFARALLTASVGTLDAQLGAAVKRVRSQSRRGTMWGVAGLLSILLLLVGCYFGVRFASRAAVHALPMSVDQQIGQAAFKAMDLGGTKVNDPIVVGAIQKIVDELKPHAALAGLDFEVHVVDSAQMNAFCLPGGVIVVYTGLIAGAENAEQVAAVIGHEMAHATLRHGMERTSQSLGMWAAISMLIGDASGLIASGADLFQIAVVNSYSREQEDAADVEGVRMMHEAGINPTAMADFFQIMEHKHGEMPEIFAWISTHPQHGDRIASVKATVAALPQRDYTPLDIDWQQVQNNTKNFQGDR